MGMKKSPFDQKVARENLGRLKTLMEERGLDLLVGSDPATVRYLTGRGVYHTRSQFEAACCEVVVASRAHDRPFVFVPSHHIQFWKARVGIVEAYASDDLTRVLGRPEFSYLRSVEFSSDTPWRLVEQIKSTLKQASFDSDGKTISESRLCKSALELEAIRRAAKVASAGMDAAIRSCKPGVRECEVAGNAERAMRVMGAEGFAFSTVVSSGVNAGIFSEISTKKRIRKGETVIIDLGATVDGYNSEFSRTVLVGKPQKAMARTYKVVYEALQESIKGLREGTLAGDVDRTARKIISSYNLPVYTHYTGHGIGTAAGENPLIGPESKEILRAGMVVALEPGSYSPSVGGVKLEENMIVNEKRPTVITRAPFEERLI
jgi:Xaa-Pro aminopeptidase